nr:hypothetical protein [Tanacetum cinerariifolium]
MSSYNHFGCSWCGGPFNGRNCSGCSSVGSRNEFVYDPNPYSYNETPNFFNQPRQHQYETYSCELCRDSPHYRFDCQTRTPLFYEKEPDEHLDTIPEKESDEFIKSSVENLVPNLSKSEDECECDVPDCDNSQTTNFLTFSNPLFDDSTSSDDKSSHEEIHNEDLDFTSKNDRFDTESYLHESLLNHDTLMALSPKIDYLLDEFADELIFLKSIPPGIDEADCDPEEDVHFVERLFYDNSSPRPPKEFNSKNSDAIIEPFSPSPIPVEDSDPFMEEIELFLASDGSIPPGIDSDYSDSEGDNLC